MTLQEARNAILALKPQFDAMDPRAKYKFMEEVRDYCSKQLKQAKDDAKDAPEPSNIKDLASYVVVDPFHNKYEVDDKGDLTKI